MLVKVFTLSDMSKKKREREKKQPQFFFFTVFNFHSFNPRSSSPYLLVLVGIRIVSFSSTSTTAFALFNLQFCGTKLSLL